MAYEKQIFADRAVDASGNIVSEGTTLTAEHLNHIEEGIATNDARISEIEKRTLNVVYVGNSFSRNASEYIYDVLTSLGYTDFHICVAYKGGCSLATHLANLKTDTAAYSFMEARAGGGHIGMGTKGLHYILTYRKWDYVIMQQASSDSDDATTYEDVYEVLNYCRKYCPSASYGWHMTWGNKGGTYENIVAAVKSVILKSAFFDFIIPAGTAIANAETSYIDESYLLEYDGYHLTTMHPFGKYMATLCTLKGILREDIDIEDVTYKNLLSDAQFLLAKECVANAYLLPFEQTQSAYTTNENLRTFTVTAAQSDATITINNLERTSASFEIGDIVNWSVALDGYTTRTGRHTMTDSEDNAITVDLEDGTEATSTMYVFGISPIPADATVTINGEAQTSTLVEANATVTWQVEAEGYVTQSGTSTVKQDYWVMSVVLDAE